VGARNSTGGRFKNQRTDKFARRKETLSFKNDSMSSNSDEQLSHVDLLQYDTDNQKQLQKVFESLSKPKKNLEGQKSTTHQQKQKQKRKQQFETQRLKKSSQKQFEEDRKETDRTEASSNLPKDCAEQRGSMGNSLEPTEPPKPEFSGEYGVGDAECGCHGEQAVTDERKECSEEAMENFEDGSSQYEDIIEDEEENSSIDHSEDSIQRGTSSKSCASTDNCHSCPNSTDTCRNKQESIKLLKQRLEVPDKLSP
jgi:hypothetical protein